MADSAFWRDLASQFIGLRDRLRAGGPTALIYKEFNVLAARCASELSNASAAETIPDLFAVWYYALREKGLASQSLRQSDEALSTDACELEMSYVDGMCEGSAILCKELEAQAVQAEFEERFAQRGDARVSQPAALDADAVLATQERARQSRSRQPRGPRPTQNKGSEEAQLTEWEKITPRAITGAIRSIRDKFDCDASVCGLATQSLCYSALQPQQKADHVVLARYKQDFVEFQSLLGTAALRRFEQDFEDVLSIGTPAAIFKAYFEAFRNGLRNLVRQYFREALQIGLANSDALEMHPVEWAKTHLKLLIREELPHVARWIKSACDGLLPPHNEDSISWGTWRAPGLVDMQPSGLAIYDPANAWGREDEQHTQELLARRSSTLIRLVELDLDNAAGNAHVACAKRGIPKVQAKKSPPQAEVAAKGPPITKGAERGGAADGQVERASKKPYRSQVKLFIAFYLLRHRDATDREICRALDADGGLDLPKGLQSKPQDRLFEQAYLDPGRRNKVEVRISKVRNDLRQAGLLPAR